MDEKSYQVYNWLLRDSSIEALLAEKFKLAREQNFPCTAVVRDFVLGHVRDLPYLQDDIGVNGNELESQINWQEIVTRLDQRQALFEMCWT